MSERRESKVDRFLDYLAEDFREAGLLTLVFIVVDYLAVDAGLARHSVSHPVIYGGIALLLTGYVVNWIRP